MKNVNKTLIQKYIWLFIAEIVIFYTYLFLSLHLVYDIDIRTGSYIGLAGVAGWYGCKLNLDIKRRSDKKNTFFTFFVFVMGIIMYLYYFDKYNLEIFILENWSFTLIFLAFILGQLNYNNKTVEVIEKENNFNFWEFIKR